MHKSVILLAAIAASGLAAETAWAKTFPIKFVSQDALAAACKKKAGGVSYTQSGGIYGCIGAGTVQCNNNTKTCTGTTPDRTASESATGVLTGTNVIVTTGAKPSKPGVPGTGGILQNDPVLSGQGPAATGSPIAPARPSASPVIIR
jgi:hypothetical protein